MGKPRIRWTAARDGIAHAHRAGRQPRTLCGMAAVDERDAWPEARRCEACVAVTAGRTNTAVVA